MADTKRNSTIVAWDILIDRLSINARKALIRRKESEELHNLGLSLFGRGTTALGNDLIERMKERGMTAK